MGNYDSWKANEPQPYEDGPGDPTDDEIAADAEDARQQVESDDARLDRALANLRETALECKTERDRFEAALTKIKNWKGYKPGPCFPPTQYETGANDMLGTLANIAEEALSEYEFDATCCRAECRQAKGCLYPDHCHLPEPVEADEPKF